MKLKLIESSSSISSSDYLDKHEDNYYLIGEILMAGVFDKWFVDFIIRDYQSTTITTSLYQMHFPLKNDNVMP